MAPYLTTLNVRSVIPFHLGARELEAKPIEKLTVRLGVAPDPQPVSAHFNLNVREIDNFLD
jgi:hypothetical protein